MKTLLPLILLSAVLGCNPIDKKQVTAMPSSANIPEPGLTERLHYQKASADTLFNQSKDKLAIWVKVTGKSQPQKVLDEKWPEDIETTFNILKDTDGKVVTVAEFPYSESGDWNISYNHYFDNDGKTYAFERQTNFFNSTCNEGVAYETKTAYYDTNFKAVANEYKLTDINKKPLAKETCSFPYEFEYEQSRDLKTYLEANNLKL